MIVSFWNDSFFTYDPFFTSPHLRSSKYHTDFVKVFRFLGVCISPLILPSPWTVCELTYYGVCDPTVFEPSVL
jgi:hypothetical protein